MKRSISFILSLALMLALAACGNSAAATTAATAEPRPTATQEPESTAGPTAAPAENAEGAVTEAAVEEAAAASNILIAYFSRVGNMTYEEGVDATTSASVNFTESDAIAGNAELLAGMVQDATGGDMFFIETESKYPAAYRATTDQAKTEQNDDARPVLVSHVEDMDAYDTVVLVYPNWWGDLPMAVFTFLEEYDFSGKTIYPLCTHEGSGLGRTPDTIADLCPDATVGEGLSVRGGSAASAQDDVAAWMQSTGLAVQE